MLRKENLAIFESSSIESSNISKTRGYAHQNWYTCTDINLYFHKFFELILFFDPMNNSPLSERYFNLKESFVNLLNYNKNTPFHILCTYTPSFKCHSTIINYYYYYCHLYIYDEELSISVPILMLSLEINC